MPTTTRHIGHCPCCQGDWKVRQGVLVHHGYKRPGDGFISGDCYGARGIPHEMSPELAKKYQVVVRREHERAKAAHEAHQTTTELRYQKWDVEARDNVWVAIHKGEYPDYLWERTWKEGEYQLKRDLRWAAEELERVTKLVDTWEARPLTTVDEEQAAKQAAKAEREAAKRAKKEARFADAIAKIQKRIDSAVKNQNSNTLAQIWEESPSKLRDILGMHWDEAIAAMDRDAVWTAFGLNGLTRESWRIGPEHPAHDILEGMQRRMDRIKGYHQHWTAKDEWERKQLNLMAMEWPEALGGENKKGAKTLAEVQETLAK